MRKRELRAAVAQLGRENESFRATNSALQQLLDLADNRREADEALREDDQRLIRLLKAERDDALTELRKRKQPAPTKEARCPTCKAKPGEPCRRPSGRALTEPHANRV